MKKKTFYVVEYPGRSARMFNNSGDAKNCLGNLGPVHKGMIKVYDGEEVSIITGIKKENKNIYTNISIDY